MSSSAGSESPVRSAVPIADLSVLDVALRGGDLAVALRKVRPADVGRDLSRRPVEQGCQLMHAADDRRAAAILLAAHPAVAGRILAGLDPSRASRIVNFMPTDHQVAILATVSAQCRTAIEQAFIPDDKHVLDRLLAHPESAVGRLMTPWIFRCDRHKTVGDAMAILRDKRDAIEVAVNCYVVDDRRLVGVVALRDLAIADPATPIEQIMTPDPIAVVETSERGDAAEIIQTHDFLSLPVIDGEGNLVGAVRVDDLLDAALAKVGVGVLNQGAVAGKVAAKVPYFQTQQWLVVRSRITWLILLFVAETATGTVLRHFEDELAKVVALSFFIPLLIGTGGNAGSQTVSTVIRALALGEVRTHDFLRVLWKEASAGIMLGLLLGVIAFGRALLWGVGYDLAACVAVTIIVVCTWANTVGSLIPVGAQRLGIDPTVISGPLITTLVDASGLFLYLTIAHIMIAALH